MSLKDNIQKIIDSLKYEQKPKPIITVVSKETYEKYYK